jgi:hypothetical protein
LGAKYRTNNKEKALQLANNPSNKEFTLKIKSVYFDLIISEQFILRETLAKNRFFW